MTNWQKCALYGVSASAMAFATQSTAAPMPSGQVQTSPSEMPVPLAEPSSPTDQPQATTPGDAAPSGSSPNDIIVTGIRSSLERAAEIKKDSVQVVDSIVAQDIGKFPDPTTAAALQRVPGVQVQNNSNNELGGVRIRGLTDILTTVDGREIFSTTDRTFDLQDLPAEALARVDVYKSQTADQIEGGVAGGIDLKLNKPFNFHKPTLVLSARENYASRAGVGNPQFGALATDRFNTGIGEIGILVNGTYSDNQVLRSQSTLTSPRSTAATPLNTPGYLLPEVIQNQSDVGKLVRKQANAAIQWQVAPALQAYVDGLYTDTHNTVGFTGYNAQPYTTNVRISNIVASNDCIQTRVTTAGQNPNVINNINPVTGVVTQTLQPNTTQTLCNIKSATLSNIVINQNSNSQLIDTTNKMVAGGLRFDRNGLKANIDIAYQTSRTTTENINTTSGQRVPTVQLETDVDDGVRLTVPDRYVLDGSSLSLRNQLNQNYSDASGSLFQAKADTEYEVADWLPKLQLGFRYAKREATLLSVQQSTPVPFGSVGTASESSARLISTLPLGPNFLTMVAYAPRLNDGTDYIGINPAFLRSEDGRNQLRSIFGLPLARPDYDPTRQFDTQENTYSSYVQGSYDVPLGTDISLDGVIGVRVSKTDRTIATFRAQAGSSALVPVSVSTSDTDILPNATARLKILRNFQTRFSYSKTIRRPDFSLLNPSLSLTIQNNPFLLSSGTAGNPDLKPQKSDSFDATLEYYTKSGYLAVTGYYRTLKDRVITASTQEDVNGANFLISRPRNVGEAELKGIEVSGQYFFDFLPGALKGFGALGAFTYADSVVKGDDSLAGYPLQGVSKYNYTAGLLYDKFGISGRLIYTFRSRYFNGDNSGTTALRPVDPSLPLTQAYIPTLLTYVRPAGRLDFSLGYDITDAFRIDVGGTNVLRNETKTYFGLPHLNNSVFGDETTYTIGVRVKY